MSSIYNTHAVPISRKIVRRPLAVIVSVILLISSIVPIMAMADSSNGGGQILV
jgi:heme/copper-type cytochrome/quinol oxidase subunit 3